MNPSQIRICGAHEDFKGYEKWGWSKNNKFAILNMISQIFDLVNVLKHQLTWQNRVWTV